MKLLRLVLAGVLLAIPAAACKATLPTAPPDARLDGDGTGFGGGGTR